MKITHPVTRAAFGVAALVIIALLANWLVSLTPLGNRGIDFTEKKIHTLSDGTKSILGELETPVVIRYYATRGTDYMPEQMKLHMSRVDDLLEEYSALSGGMLRIENLNPEPDTEAEDSANLDGISGQRFNDQNLYFGLAISCIDKTRVIPFLDPREETMLEYMLSKAIAEVSTPIKPKIGVMSGLNIKGGGPAMMGQRPSNPWVMYQQLQNSFELVDLPITDPVIDPDEIKVLFVFHPAGITPAAEFAIDQYLLQGGTVVACLDPHSRAAQMVGGNPMMGMGGAPITSTLPTLLPAWGLEFESGMALADPVYATELRDNQNQTFTGLAVLTLPHEAMPQEDSVITRDLDAVTLFVPGAFSRTDACQLGFETLIQSSARAGFVDSQRAARLDPALAGSFEVSGKPYPLVARLHGMFTTAFPDGNPAAGGEDDKPAQDQAAAGKALKQATAKGNVFLIGDIDAFFDIFAYNVRNFNGLQMASPINGNSSLLFNILDQAVGSRHLIGSRSRAAMRRPFTVIKEMEDQFEREVGDKRTELGSKEQDVIQRLNELQVQRSRGNQLYLSPQQEAEIRKLRTERVRYARQIRELEKDLQRQKDDLTGTITLLNVAVMPALVILTGIGLFFHRRRATRAR